MLTETLLAAIAEAVFGSLLRQAGLAERVRAGLAALRPLLRAGQSPPCIAKRFVNTLGPVS